MSKKSKGPCVDMDSKWRAESDLRTLREAEEIKSDKSRVSAAKTEATKQMSALSRVTGSSPARSSRPASSPARRLANKRI